jgi:tetratricopeptide (TPR) repeat protein
MLACAHAPPPPQVQRSWEVEQAHDCALSADEAQDKKGRSAFAECGARHARAAVAQAPARVEGHYYLAWSLWLLASTRTFTAYALMMQARDAALVAYRIDRRFDRAGPARLLGWIFAEAPPWPASIGNLDSGIAFLQEAVKLAPADPENHLRLGNAYKTDNRIAEARREYQIVLAADPTGEFARPLRRWQEEARGKR